MDSRLQELLLQAAQSLKAAGAREVFVFGSAADGELREGSDVDLAVSGLPPERFYEAMSDVVDIFKRPVDLVDLDESSLFTEYLQRRGKLLRVA